MRYSIVGLGVEHLAQEGHSLLRVALQEKRVAEMIGGDRIGRANLQLGAKFRGRGFEIALAKLDEAHEIVGFGETRGGVLVGFKVCETPGKGSLSGGSLTQEKIERMC